VFDSIGWGEIVVLALAALFVFGPERLPHLAKDAAGALRRVRHAMGGAQRQLHETLGGDVPDLRDIDLRRYHPKALLREHLLGTDDDPPAADPTGVSARVRWAAPRSDEPADEPT
jgi:sec-independent protein translocase protein TatB